MTGSASTSTADHDGFGPIFIVGCERSGTTLLSTLLDRHSQLAVTPESHFFTRVWSPHQADHTLLDHKQLIELVQLDPRCADLDLDDTELLDRFQGYPCDFKHLFQAMLEVYGAKTGKPRVGEKTPGHLEFVPRILQWYPRSKIICIVRDGRDVVHSLMKVQWTRKDPRLQGMMWRWAAKTALQYKAQHPSSFLVIRFEDLLENPKDTLQGLCTFVDLPFDVGMLQPSQASAVVPQWENQWKGKATQELDPSRVGAWRATTSPQEKWLLNSMMGNQLRAFDYPDADLAGCAWSSRLRHRVSNLICRVRYWGPVHRLCSRIEKKRKKQ